MINQFLRKFNSRMKWSEDECSGKNGLHIWEAQPWLGLGHRRCHGSIWTNPPEIPAHVDRRSLASKSLVGSRRSGGSISLLRTARMILPFIKSRTRLVYWKAKSGVRIYLLPRATNKRASEFRWSPRESFPHTQNSRSATSAQIRI